jgi:hypothetical protein
MDNYNKGNILKEKIISRTFSYKYEEMVYEIFSPYAIQVKRPFEKSKWEVNESLEKEFVKKEIQRILQITDIEASKLLDELIKNKIIYESGVCVDWKKSCSLGYLLAYEWDIISKTDNNLSKWMESHPIIESKESANKRREEVIKKKEEELKNYY